jgi:hypothetical protein
MRSFDLMMLPFLTDLNSSTSSTARLTARLQHDCSTADCLSASSPELFVAFVDDGASVDVARLIANAVVEARLTAHAASAAFPFHRNAFAVDPPRVLVVVPPRSPSS